MAACGSCGTGLHNTAKFCGECGAAVAGGDGAAKYKQVTVLFADVVRSMDLAAVVDIERLREIMSELLARSTAVMQRYGGTVEYNGDGVMALFGAPIALEDHAFRGCLAALALQEEANALSADVQRDDGVRLQLRVGLNSGRVITGEIGDGSLGYHATGAPIGIAQRMEAAAPPGGVMMSEATARLVEHRTVLAEPEWVRVKGTDDPVCARRLVAINAKEHLTVRTDPRLVGRRWEMAALDAMVERAVKGRGGVVHVVGPPGIGKSRVAREAASLAAAHGVEVAWAYCESHTRDVPFGAVAQLLRAAVAAVGLDAAATRLRVRQLLPQADEGDVLLVDDVLGVADPTVARPQIDPDARRRRLAALVNSATLARSTPALFIVEDAHWIDPVSESMLADFLELIPQTTVMGLVTSRPEYAAGLTRTREAQTIALVPLADSDTATLLDELLGPDPSVRTLASVIAARAAGNPFFAEEMVRELAQRGVLTGEQGQYVCRADVAEVAVPVTVQAAIEARIDRLGSAARRTLNTAAVIGARFDAELLAALEIEPSFDELLRVELIDRVRFTPTVEYAFRHPLILAVAYEAQLKSDRAESHRRLAAAIESADPESADQNAALIAEHLESAGELLAAYGWHMRAAAWSTERDVGAARAGWASACRIADKLPADAPGQLSMRIAPRTMLCATDWLGRPVQKTWGRFEELRQLCATAGDKVSLAIGMTGLGTELLYTGRAGEGSALASEQMSLLESIGNPELTVGLSFCAFANWFNRGEFGQILRWSQVVIELADGDPAVGAGYGIGSPVALALTFRAVARFSLGRPGWRQDMDEAVAMARRSDPGTVALVVAWTLVALLYGVVTAEDPSLGPVEEAMRIAEGSSNDFAVAGSHFALGAALLYRESAADRRRGLDLMIQSRDVWLPDRAPSLVPFADLLAAQETARCGDLDGAIPRMRRAADSLLRAERLGWGIGGTTILVETLVQRGTESDLAEAQTEIARLANMRVESDVAVLDISLLRLRALLARARGDALDYRELAARYRTTAETLGFEGHKAWAAAMN